MCALTQPEARNELVVLGKQLLSARCPHFLGLSCPLPGRCGTRDLQRRGSPRCMFSLRSFAVLPDGSFQEATQRENLIEASGGLGLMWPAFLPTPPLTPALSPPHSFRFLQFVKLVIIFLGAFFLFFKCKVYLYSVFKVVKKKKPQNKTT